MITVLTCGSSKSAQFCSEDSNFDLLHIGSCKRDETRLRPQHAAHRNQHTFMQKTLISTCYSKSANFSSNNKLRQLLVKISTFQFEWLWVRLVTYRNQRTPVQMVTSPCYFSGAADISKHNYVFVVWLDDISTLIFGIFWLRLAACRNWKFFMSLTRSSACFCSEYSEFGVLLVRSCRNLETQLCLWHVPR